MTREIAKARDVVSAIVRGRLGLLEVVNGPLFTFDVVCRRNGKLVWRDVFRNTVMTAGKNDLLDKYFSGSAYTASWYMGLISGADFSAINAADTMASHAGWKEASASAAPNYDEANRPAVSFASASNGTKATSAGVEFTIAESGTLKGAFLVTNNTKGGTTGVLYSAGLFSGGDRAVQDNDVLSVTGSWSIS